MLIIKERVSINNKFWLKREGRIMKLLLTIYIYAE